MIESEWFKQVMVGIEGGKQGEVDWRNAWGEFSEANLDQVSKALKVNTRRHSANLNSKR